MPGGTLQLLAYNEGVKLFPVTGHIGKKHIVTGEINQDVICFHNFSIYETPKNYSEIAISEDGLIEGIRHNHLPIEGWMWHPERKDNFSEIDIDRIKKLFC